MRLLGGADRELLWTPDSLPSVPDRLEFWYERWTARGPFTFQVDLLIDGQWKSAYVGPGDAPVGRFRNRVSIPLQGEGLEQVRFTSSTPSGSGVMIDDLSIQPNLPQRVSRVIGKQRTIPLLLGNQWNPVYAINIQVQGNQDELTLNAVEVALGGSLSLDSIEKAEVISSASAEPAWFNIVDLEKHKQLSVLGRSTKPTSRMTIRGETSLERGDNHLFISITLKDEARVSDTLEVKCPSVIVAGQPQTPVVMAQQLPLRVGHALRRAGEDGVNTYRIPGLATTNTGTLLAVYDVRYRSAGDLPGNIDVGMSRSADGGRSWEAMRVIMDLGSDPKWRFDGIGDPAVLVDTQTGTIWVAALWSHGNRAWHGSGPGLSPEETGQFMLVRSDDDGRTWSDPINITEQIKNPEWNLLFNGPGKGICMQDGTLVFAAQYRDTNRVPHSTIVYSKDHGATWEVGTGAHPETTEAQVIEVRPGTLMLNCRYNKSSARVVMTSSDLGKTWKEHVSSKKNLIEPGACMASLIDVDQELGKSRGGWLLFSNPASLQARENLTIKASSNGGDDWPEDKQLLLDEGRSAGYSCMSMIDSNTVGIVYEGSTSQLAFQRIPLTDIIDLTTDHARDPSGSKSAADLPANLDK